jgi:Zn-dependent protease
MFNMDPQILLNTIPAIVIALTIHEFSHAFAAYKLGDSTAESDGRLTLNPLKHIDPLGMVFLVVAGFGWARPVRFNPDNLKHQRRDRILIALAGPLSNFLVALLSIAVIKLIILTKPYLNSIVGEGFSTFFVYFTYINLGLAIFNMIPIPPLDGSHLLFSGMKMNPKHQAWLYRYGFILLFAVILIENHTNLDILPIARWSRAFVLLFF